MSNVVHLGVVGEHTGFTVILDGVIFPRSLKQLVNDFEVFVGVIVPTIVFHLVVIAHIARCRRQVTGHNVPTEASTGQVVQRGQSAGKRKWMLIGGACGDTESEMFGDGCHGRNDQHRIVDWHLGARGQRGVGVITVDVVGTEHIGNK